MPFESATRLPAHAQRRRWLGVVFQEITGTTPGEYRNKRRPPAEAGNPRQFGGVGWKTANTF
jgi:hypothetical protein